MKLKTILLILVVFYILSSISSPYKKRVTKKKKTTTIPGYKVYKHTKCTRPNANAAGEFKITDLSKVASLCNQYSNCYGVSTDVNGNLNWQGGPWVLLLEGVSSDHSIVHAITASDMTPSANDTCLVKQGVPP